MSVSEKKQPSKQFSRRQFFKWGTELGIGAAATMAFAFLPESLTAAGTGVADRLKMLPVGGFIIADSQNPQNSIIDRSASSEERLRVANELAQAVNGGDGTYRAWGRVWNRNNPSVALGQGVRGSYDYFRVQTITQPQISKDNVLGFDVTVSDGTRMALAARDLLVANPGQRDPESQRASFPQFPDNLMEVMPQIYQTLTKPEK